MLRKAMVQAFNTAVNDLAKSDRYFMTKHFHSAQSTEAEREAFVPDGAGGFYVAINPRDEAPTITVADTAPEKKSKGGTRPGAGRPMKKERYRRVQLQDARIPGWLMDWVRDQGNAGRLIEQALIAQHGLTPPA